MNVALAFNLIWKNDNSSPLLQKFIAQVEAEKEQIGGSMRRVVRRVGVRHDQTAGQADD
jgi:hypothetical protein